MFIIWTITIISLFILIYLSVIGKKRIFDSNKIKPNFIIYISFSYLSVLLLVVFSIIVFFIDREDAIVLLKYFLDFKYDNIPEWIRYTSNIISIIFSLSNLYILVALVINLLLLKKGIDFLIPIIFTFIYSFTWSFSIRLLDHYMGLNITNGISLDPIMFRKLTYIEDMFNEPHVVYLFFLMVTGIIYCKSKS